MNVEVETKLSVPNGFVLPVEDLRNLGMPISDISVKVTRTIYLDTANLDLAACGAAIRFRSELDNGRDGIWTLKFSSPQSSSVVSRFELEVSSDGEHFPSKFRTALRVFGADSELRPITTLLANRSSISFIGNDGNRVVEIDDDVVKVQSDVHKSHAFREIEVEVTDPLYRRFSERVVDVLLSSGAFYADSSSKLEQALAVTMDTSQILKVFERFSKESVAQLTGIARFVLEESETNRDVSNDFYRLITFDLELDAAESLLRYLMVQLENLCSVEQSSSMGPRARISQILFEYADLIRTGQIADTLNHVSPVGLVAQKAEFLIESIKNGTDKRDAVGETMVKNWIGNLVQVMTLDVQELPHGINELFASH